VTLAGQCPWPSSHLRLPPHGLRGTSVPKVRS
jgi:hypothetical protein